MFVYSTGKEIIEDRGFESVAEEEKRRSRDASLFGNMIAWERRNRKHQFTKYQVRTARSTILMPRRGSLSREEACVQRGKLKITLRRRPGATENCHVGLLRGIAQLHPLHPCQNYRFDREIATVRFVSFIEPEWIHCVDKYQNVQAILFKRRQ